MMWKPVRLQGVGAASVTINADAHPAGKMDPWRRQVNCVFGLTLDGTPQPGQHQLRRTIRTGKGTPAAPAMHPARRSHSASRPSSAGMPAATATSRRCCRSRR